ncbi:unnamed protein product [Natator depressus]
MNISALHNLKSPSKDLRMGKNKGRLFRTSLKLNQNSIVTLSDVSLRFIIDCMEPSYFKSVSSSLLNDRTPMGMDVNSTWIPGASMVERKRPELRHWSTPRAIGSTGHCRGDMEGSKTLLEAEIDGNSTTEDC